MTYRRSAGFVAALLALPLLLPRPAHALAGSTALTGASVLAVHGCGHDRSTLTAVLQVADGGTWTVLSQDGPSFTGTYVPKGKSGRKLVLTVAAASEQAIAATAVADIEALCNAQGVVVTAVRAKVLTLTLDKKLTTAKLVVRYLLKGSANGRSGTATLRITAKGPWTPA
jgi:hypothetical protein